MVDNIEHTEPIKEKTEINTPILDSKSSDRIYEFIEEVFMGIENKVWALGKEKEEASDKMNTKEGMMYGINFLEYYLNQLYKILVEKTDEFILKKFTEMGHSINLHPVYTLNLITNVIMKCYPMIPRSKLRVSSEEEYIESVKNISLTMRKYMLTLFEENLKKLNEEKIRIENEKEKEKETEG